MCNKSCRNANECLEQRQKGISKSIKLKQIKIITQPKKNVSEVQ